MTPEQIIAIITAAKANGLSWLKTEGLEFRVSGDPLADIAEAASKIPAVPTIAFNDPVLPPEEEAVIKHKVEELKSVMGMGDLELLDRLFPEPQEEAAS